MRVRAMWCAVAVSGWFAAGAGAQVVKSGFHAGLEGWTISNTVGAQWMGGGGNPGGYAHIDNTEMQIAYMGAPGAFLGDLSAYDGGQISFDARQVSGGGDPWDSFENFGRLRIIGPTITATLDLVSGTTGPAPMWTRYPAPLTAAAWGVSEANWQILLSNVTAITLSVEGLFGAEVNGVDNFTIRSADAIPCNAADLAAPHGQLNFDDVIAFLVAFQEMATDADLAAPPGLWDFSDVVAFVTLFSNGCP